MRQKPVSQLPGLIAERLRRKPRQESNPSPHSSEPPASQESRVSRTPTDSSSEPQEPDGWKSQRSTPKGTVFEEALRHADIADELIISPEYASWQKGRFAAGRRQKGIARSQASGVRFQEWDRSFENPSRERQCQSDVARLVHSVRKLREIPEYENLVLSEDLVTAHSIGERDVTRVKFGVRVPPSPSFAKPEKAARECHRQIVRAAKRAGYIVEQPKKFDPKSGLLGLESWSNQLLLRRQRELSPLWLLPLLLALVLLFPWQCDQKPSEFFGVEVGHQSLLVLVDVSSSMQPVFESIQGEVKRTLTELQSRTGDTKPYVNVITYAQNARSMLGGLRPLDDEVFSQLSAEVDQLQIRGGTRLESAFQMAAEEIATHAKPTTIIVLTDGEDSSISRIIEQKATYDQSLNSVEVQTFALTPRLCSPKNSADTNESTPPTPDSRAEQELERLSSTFGGHFGSLGDQP